MSGTRRLSRATKTTLLASAGVAMDTSPADSERKVAIWPMKKSAPAATPHGAAEASHPSRANNASGRKSAPIERLLKKVTDHVSAPRLMASFTRIAAVA